MRTAKIIYQLFGDSPEGVLSKNDDLNKVQVQSKTPEIFSKKKEEIEENYKQIPPSKAHDLDSGFDLFLPEKVVLASGTRTTVDLKVRFEPQLPIIFKVLNWFGAGIGMELQIRPKSGQSKKGIDVQLGTIDKPYRGYCGATICNNTGSKVTLPKGYKICQVVPVPVFNKAIFVSGNVDPNQTTRGTGGFGSTGN